MAGWAIFSPNKFLFGEENQLPGEKFYDAKSWEIIAGSLLPDPGFNCDGTGIYARTGDICGDPDSYEHK